MKKIGFIGAYDKIDLIIYVAKILTVLKKKVLVIDATTNQKARYVIPAINPTIKYVTEYEEIDIAVGFSNIADVKKYLGLTETQDLEYDIILVDTDNPQGLENYELGEAQKNYFVTSFDAYSLKKGLEIFARINRVISVTKVLFSRTTDKEEDDYLNFLSLGYKIAWEEQRLYFPFETADLCVIQENQRVAKIKFKKLSASYKDGLGTLAEEILGDNDDLSSIRRAIKIIERGA